MAVIDTLQRRYCTRALAVAVVLGLATHLAGWPAASRGLLVGSLFSVLNFILLGKELARHLDDAPQRGRVPKRIARVGRYLLGAVPVVLAIRLPAVDLPATVAGMFMVPLTILLEAVIHHLGGTGTRRT